MPIIVGYFLMSGVMSGEMLWWLFRNVIWFVCGLIWGYIIWGNKK